jgi:cation transport regulator ChaC
MKKFINPPPFYFAYGSNMNPERMRERGAYFKNYMRGILKNYRLKFNKRCYTFKGFGCANVEPAEGEVVEGVLYELEKPREAIEMLDLYEGYPDHYNRLILEIETEKGKFPAVVYIAQPWMIDDRLKPHFKYLVHLLEACRLKLLSDEYCKKIKAAFGGN